VLSGFRSGLRPGANVYVGAMFKPVEFFDLSQTEHASIFEGCEYAWDALKRIQDYVSSQVHPASKTVARGGLHWREGLYRPALWSRMAR